MRHRMSRASLGLVMILGLPMLTHAGDEASDAPIKITINPESRVSVALGGELPPPGLCGTATELRVDIVNRGFVTAQLEASLVGDVQGTTLDFRPKPLVGQPEEFRTLRITLTKPGSTDLTVSFKAHGASTDLGGRDRVHFLMRCRYALSMTDGHD